MKALPILFLVLGGGAAGCLGAPDARGPAGQGAYGLDAVAPEVEPDPDRAALAGELWCAACVAEGLRARFDHDVRFHTTRASRTVFVEIDGVLACAGRAKAAELELLVELEGDAEGGGEDEGNPDPEPALHGDPVPSPVPPPSIGRKQEDEGNPDPEPALGDDLPAPTPGLGDPGDFGK